MFRQSMVPSNKRQTLALNSSSSSVKARQMAHLNSQLAQLQANISDMDNLLRVAVVQAEYIRKLGILHGSLFMASHRVFEEEAMNEQEQNQPAEEEYNEMDMS